VPVHFKIQCKQRHFALIRVLSVDGLPVQSTLPICGWKARMWSQEKTPGRFPVLVNTRTHHQKCGRPFQVSTDGRFWVSPEDIATFPELGRRLETRVGLHPTRQAGRERTCGEFQRKAAA
jgi:hypothetical protein